MRPIAPALADRLAQPVTRLVACWDVARTDGVRLGFTAHDRDLRIDGRHYRAQAGFQPSAVEQAAGTAVGNLTAQGVLGTGGLNETELVEGRYDGARVTVFLVDWAEPTLGTVPLFAGKIGDLTMAQDGFEADLRDVAQALENRVGVAFSSDCRAALGDTRCKVNLRGLRETAAITRVDAADRFRVSTGRPSAWFDAGQARFWSGPNAGTTMEIAAQAGSEITLFLPPPRSPTVGDLVELTAGCDKRLTSCVDKFQNAANFRGEPFVPGTDSLLAYPNG